VSATNNGTDTSGSDHLSKMSGVYYTVWPARKQDEVSMIDRNPPLQTTLGGYPHLTLFHITEGGRKYISNTEKRVFLEIGVFGMEELMGKEFTVTDAFVYSYTKDDVDFHSVHLSIDLGEAEEQVIQRIRRKIDDALSFELLDYLVMRKLHITYQTYPYLRDADAVCAKLNSFSLPLQVKVIGFTI
jgi:hypothetical protein